MENFNHLKLNTVKPDYPAVIWYENSQQHKKTYQELENEISRRCSFFCNKLKIKPGDIVGVLAPRGPEYLINMLALWQIGAVYLPLSDAWREPNALVNRLEQAKARYLLTVKSTQASHKIELDKLSDQAMIICLDTPALSESNDLNSFSISNSSPTELAYIFSSSGTTGEPKLIALPHAGISDRIQDHIDLMGIKFGDGVLGFIDFGFDASVVEMLLAICTGNTLYIVDQTVRNQCHQEIPRFINAHADEIKVAILLPSVLKGIYASQCRSLKKIVTMGEACLLDSLHDNGWFKSADLYNGYGPTETTFGASLTPLLETDLHPSIQRPMRGITLYLCALETHRVLAKTENGVWQKDSTVTDKQELEGEILIGGNGIGCYLNLPEKNTTKFLDPNKTNIQGFAADRLFITGDNAKLDGTQLIYQYRLDNQIKRYGVLITLDEVENALKGCSIIADVIVLCRDNNLIAFIISKNPAVMQNADIRDTYNEQLNTFISNEIEQKLKPNACFWIDKIPEQKNERNKISRNLEDYRTQNLQRAFPKSCITQDEQSIKISNIWQSLLESSLNKFEKIEAMYYPENISFKYLGGDSLLMSIMIQKIWEDYKKEKTPVPNDFARAIVSNPTIHNIKQLLSYYSHNFVKRETIDSNHITKLPLFIFPSQITFKEQWLEKAPGCLYSIIIPESLVEAESESKTLISLLKTHCKNNIPEFGACHFICDSNEKQLAEKLIIALNEIGIEADLTIFDRTLNIDIFIINLNQWYYNQSKSLIEKKIIYLKSAFIKNSSHKDIKINSAAKLDKFIMNSNNEYPASSIYWLIGNAQAGKTTLLQNCLQQNSNPYVLVLNVLDIQDQNVFQTALLKAFPKWQWEYLRSYPLVVIIEDYDAINRLDCPNLLQQAIEAGFDQVRFVISCRKTYWSIYEQELLQFTQPNNSFTDLKLFNSIDINKDFLSYQVLVDWFKTEHKRCYSNSSEDDFIYQSFKTLYLLYTNYKNTTNQLISLKSRESHWENGNELPCVHALPNLQAVLPLLDIDFDLLCAAFPTTWQDNIPEYYSAAEQALANTANQTLSTAEIQNLQNKNLNFDFWKRLPTNARLHVLPLQYVSGSTPIFIFHPLTGDTPVNYRTLAEALGPQQTLIALQMSDEDNQLTINEKSNLYIDYLKLLQPQGPYILMGWSFGAILAHHTAILLEQQGLTVDYVINIDSPPPTHIDNTPMGARALDMIDVLAKTIYQIPVDLQSITQLISLKNIKDEIEKTDFYFDHVIKQLSNTSHDEAKIHNFYKALEKTRINLKVYYDFANQYKKPFYKLKAQCLVFEATEKRPILNDSDFQAWESYIENLKIIKLKQKNHFNLFSRELFEFLKIELKPYQAKYHGTLAERLNNYRQQQIVAVNTAKHSVQSIYIAARATLEPEDKNSELLDQAVKKFLYSQSNKQEVNCFLLLGEPGSGKSYFGRKIMQSILTQQPLSYFPLLINLKPNSQNYLKTALLKIGFTDYEYNELKSQLETQIELRTQIIQQKFGAPLLIIFDGYDEALTEKNFYVAEQLDIWQAKIFINCRTYAVNILNINKQFGDPSGRVQTYYLQPFTDTDIKNYLNIYEKNCNITLNKSILNNPQVKNLIKTPLLLSIAVKLWNKLTDYRYRAQLYQAFFKKLAKQDRKKIQKTQGIRAGVDLEKAITHYSQAQAIQYWRQIYSSELQPITSSIVLSDSYDADTQQVTKANGLGIDAQGRLSHITFWEYHFATAIINKVLEQDFKKLDSAYPNLLGEKSFTNNLSLLAMVQESALLLEPIQLAHLKNNLLLMVYASRHHHVDPAIDTSIVIAAANSISILNVMQVPFSGLDMRNIRVPNAYLKGALFDTTCLRNADLSGTNLQNSLLRYADLRGASLIDTDFAEQSMILFKNQGFVKIVVNNSECTLLAAAIGNKIELWDISRNKFLFTYETDNELNALAFSPDNKYLAFAWIDNVVYLWSIETRQIIKSYQLQSIQLVRTIIFSPDGKSLFAAGKNHPESYEQTILQWDISSEFLTAKYHTPANFNFCLAVSSNGKFLATSSKNKIFLWDTVSKKKLAQLAGHFGDVSSISFSPNNQLLASGGEDNTIRLWNIIEQKQIACFNNSTKSVTSVAFSPNSEVLVCGSEDHNVYIYDVKNYKLLGSHKEHRSVIRSVFFTPDGKNLISSSDDNSVSKFKVNKLVNKDIYLMNSSHYLNNDIRNWTSSTSSVTALNKQLTANIDGRIIRIVHHFAQKIITLNTGSTWDKSCIALFPNQPWLVSADSSIRIWDVNTGKCLDVCYAGDSFIVKITISNEGVITTRNENKILQVFAPNRSLPLLHYQLVQQGHAHSHLISEYALLDGCKISAANHGLLSISLMANPWSYQLWPLPTEDAAQRFWPIQPYPIKLWHGCITDIFYPNILHRLSLKDWQALTYVNKQMQQHFGYLFQLHQLLVRQVLPSLPTVTELKLFLPTAEGLRTSFVDTKGITYQYVWPSWFLQQLTPLRPILVKNPKVALEISHQSIWQITFSETSPRRLVYLLSTTYLLQAALKKTMQLGLVHRLSREPISEYYFYHLCLGLGIVKLKQLLRFLNQHNIVIYDEVKKTIALTELGEALGLLAECSEMERITLAEKCIIDYQENSLTINADNALTLVAGMYSMGVLAKLLHIWATHHFFDDLEQPPLTFSTLETIETLKNQPNSSSYLALFISCFSDLALTNMGELLAVFDFSKFLGVLLRFNFLAITENGTWSLTPLSEYLTRNHPETLLPVLEIPNEAWWKAVDYFRLGEQPAFEIINEQSFFKYLASNPDVQAKFNQGLASLTHFQNENIAIEIPIKPNNKIVDIAGGAGGLLTALQKVSNQKNYHCQFTLYDQSSVISQVKTKQNFQPTNWYYVIGDFFATQPKNNLPSGHDIYLLKGTLHDFNDEKCLQILTHIREVIPSSSYLYIIERTLVANQKPNINAYGDLMMLMLLGGKGRYAHEWLKLFLQCGFEWVNSASPTVVEDHTIMVCKPKQLEISSSLRFFKTKLPQSNSTIFQQLLELAHQHDKKLHEVLTNGFNHLKSEYHSEHMYLLLQAVVCDNEEFTALPALNSLNSRDYHLVFADEYALIPVQLECEQWAGLLIDKWRNQVFYFDVTNNEMPIWVKDFINKISLKPKDLQITCVNHITHPLILDNQSKHTGAVLIALFANMVHKIQVDDSPSTPVEIEAYLNGIVNMLAYDPISSPQDLREQQLQWAINHLQAKASQVFTPY